MLIAGVEIRLIFFPYISLYFWRKWSASRMMSDRRSRRGGRWMGKTFSR